MIIYASRSNVKKEKMYAIVEIAGQQFKVENGQKIFVHRLEAEIGKEIEFDQVLLIENEGKITIGEPTIKDAVVGGRILDRVRGDKVIVFKKKRKKGYRVKNGHRQNFSQIEIISINGIKAPVKKAHKKAELSTVEAVVTEESTKPKKAAKKIAVAKEEAPVKKTTKKVAEKKVAEKKPAEKKPAVKKSTRSKE
jgi:large subunit ribosomal protein L21